MAFTHFMHRDTQGVMFSFLRFLWFYKNNSGKRGTIIQGRTDTLCKHGLLQV